MDHVDGVLARCLRRDGRMSFLELARAAGISRASASARVGAMIESGVLRIVGVVNPAVGGHGWAAHVSVRVDGAARPVADAIAGLPGAAFVSLTAGRFGVVAEMRADTFDALGQRQEELRGLPRVRSAECVVYRRVLRDLLAPTIEPTAQPDAVDLRILAALSVDGRRSYARLGQDVGLSANAARSRVLHLLEAHVLHVGAIVRRGAEDQEHNVGVGVSIHGPGDDLVELVDSTPLIEFAALGIGRWDLVMTVRAPSHREITQCVEVVRELTCVGAIDLWTHLDVIKDVHGSR